MIPDHLIDQAWHAYVRSSNQQAIRNEMAYPDLRGPMPPPPDPRLSMRAALEAVAADIWDEGYEACEGDVSIYTNWNTETPNPYRGATNG